VPTLDATVLPADGDLFEARQLSLGDAEGSIPPGGTTARHAIGSDRSCVALLQFRTDLMALGPVWRPPANLDDDQRASAWRNVRDAAFVHPALFAGVNE
jgi:hypothetical protein